ncbi:cAMP-responsive element modulator isoform X1 [Rhinoderma darwinii]|uniref:cAMP-responsive element modulator isoform X1 n=1 Tax=Rhinoderma darwinii TaxID=43563 RepID=UPI003F67850D
MTMESPDSQQHGELYAVSECDSIDVVSRTPVGSKKKVKIVEPWEYLQLPEAGESKRRCHPYKSILKELSTEDSAFPESIQQHTEENRIQSPLTTMTCPTQWHPLTTVIPTCMSGPNGMQGLPAFAMSNPGGPKPGDMVPYVGLAGDGTTFYIPGNGVLVPAASGEMPAHQIHTPGSGLPHGIVMAASSTSLHIPQQIAEEVTRKREMRLMKNREAAKACRLRRKEYIRCLESHNAMLEMHIKQLMQELEAYRNMYSQSAE